MKRKTIFVLISLACFIIASCGYRFSDKGELTGGVSKIKIIMFENLTGETGIEHTVTNDIISELMRNNVEIVNKKEEATLYGTVALVSVDTISHDDISRANERRIKISVNIKLVENTGKTLLSVEKIEASEEYSISESFDLTKLAKEVAISKISGKIAEEVYLVISENF